MGHDRSGDRKKPENARELNRFNKKELSALCEEYGLSTTGIRNDLYDRLMEHYAFNSEGKKDNGNGEDVGKIEEKPGIGKKFTEDQDITVTDDIRTEEREVSVESHAVVEDKESNGSKLISELSMLNTSRDYGQDLEEVLKGYNQLLAEYPDNENILINKGVCLQYKQDYEGAIDCYVGALKINPGNIEARMLLDGCRAMGIASTFPEGVEKDAPSGPAGEISVEIKGAEAESDGTGVDAEEPELVSDMDHLGSEQLELKVNEKLVLKINEVAPKPEKVHIAGTVSQDHKQDRLLGDGISDFDTSTLTRSKSKLTDVLKELKSELRKPSGNGEEDLKPHELENKSLKEILDSKKSDDDFGSRILSSARKLLSMSEDIDYESVGKTDVTKAIEEPASGGETELVKKPVLDFTDKLDLPEKGARPRRMRRTAAVKKQLRTGNVSLDKLLRGGFMTGSNILVNGPTFFRKDIFLFKFATLGLRMDIPSIIINPDTAPATIRNRLNNLLSDITEYEKKNLLVWLDPESDLVKEQFARKKETKFPAKHQLILDGLDYFSEQLLADFDTYNVVFFSLTPLVMFQEPPVINKFLSQFSKKIKDDNVVALYTIDNDSLEQQELNFVKRVMDGVLELKQEDSHDEHRDPQHLIKIDKMPNVQSYEWHFFKDSEKNFEIKEIPNYKTVM